MIFSPREWGCFLHTVLPPRSCPILLSSGEFLHKPMAENTDSLFHMTELENQASMGYIMN